MLLLIFWAACNNTPLIALAREFIVISLREREQVAIADILVVSVKMMSGKLWKSISIFFVFTVILRITKNAIGILVLAQFRLGSDERPVNLIQFYHFILDQQSIATKNAIGISVSMNLKTSHVNCH